MTILDKKNIDDILSLTSMQEGMLFHYLKDPESDYYSEQLTLQISGEIDFEIFEKTWNFVIETNEMLRTVFRWENVEHPMQIVLKENKIKPGYYDCEDLDPGGDVSKKRKRLEEIKEKDRKEKFDLRDVPFRVILCRTGKNRYEMIISNHHILYDGWSNGIVLKEFFKTYDDLVKEKKPVKPAKTKFKEYIKWLQHRDKNKEEEFWKNHLKGTDIYTYTELSIKRKKGENVRVQKAGTYPVMIDQESVLKWEDFIKEHKITLASLLYCVWGLLLQRYNNSKNVIFGTTVSARPTEVQGIEEIVGLFINTVPLRIQGHDRETLEDLLYRIDKELRAREAFSATPLVSIKEYSGKESIENLFDTIVVFENYPLDSMLTAGNSHIHVDSYKMAEQTHYDLTIGITRFKDLRLNFTYNKDAFDEDTIVRLAAHFITIAENIVENPGQGVFDIDILPGKERNQLLYEFNNTAADFPEDKTLHELFIEQTNRTPDHIAIVGAQGTVPVPWDPISITYKELNEKSDQLAHHLRVKGVGSDIIVGIKVERSIEMITGILGILKAGGAYLPIDPDYPQERINYMLNDSTAALLLTARELSNVCRGTAWGAAHPAHKGAPTNLAYIIYTSGSTGRPKGVMVEHKNVVNVVTRFGQAYGLQEGIHVIQVSDYTFDASVDQIFGTLLHGAVLVLVNKRLLSDIQLLRNYMKRNCIHVINFVPSLLKELLADGEKLESLRAVISGAERLDGIVKDKILQKGYRLYNHYGPTETTIDTTASRCTSGSVHLGCPISNVRCYILDNQGHLLPVGIAGELYISGAGVSRGYLNRPGLTFTKFVGNPFIKGKRMYRSGDLCRWLPDGNIEFLGRLDHQVKIRGFRIEPEEIENRLLRHEKVKEAVVIAGEDQVKEKYLCAYIVPYSGEAFEKTVIELREYLSSSLPDYMIPAYFVPLEKVPVTTPGKIDRKALPGPQIVSAAEYTAPRDRIETSLVDIWHRVLNVDKKRIGIDDNFFHLGGHSLKAISLIGKIHKEFKAGLSITGLFKTPTIRGLAQYINKTGERLYSSIEPAEKKEYYALSSAQKRLFILHRMDKNGTAYNMCEALLVEGKLEKEKLENVFRELIIRHESLRTSFVVLEQEPVQRVHDEVEFGIESFDLATEAGGTRNPKGHRNLLCDIGIISWNKNKKLKESSTEKKEKIQNSFIRLFDLSKAPLLRVGLIKIDLQKHILLADMHHIISDGVSAAVFVKEFMSIYKGERLPVLHIHYKDFSGWQNHEKQKEWIKQQEKHWIKEFEDEIPVLNLPFNYQRPEVQRFEGSRLQFRIEPTETGGLKTYALKENATLYMVLLAIYNVLLFKLSGQEDITVGTPAAGRRHADLEPVIGFFINTLPLRNFPNGEKTVKQFIEEVKQRTLQAFAHQDYPYEELVEKVAVERDTSRNPLFDTVFSMQNFDDPGIEIAGLKVKPYDYETRTAKFDMALQGWEKDENLWFTLEYSTKLFKRAAIRRFVIYFKEIITSLLEDSSKKLAEIDILPEEEKKQVLYDFNDTAAEYPADKTLHELFADQVEKTPDSAAVIGVVGAQGTVPLPGKHIFITYKKLDEKSSQLAHLLYQKGVRPNTIVGLLMERSVEMVIGMMGILKAGGAYLPIGTRTPVQRVNYLLEDSNTEILVSEVSELSEGTVVVKLSEMSDEIPIHLTHLTHPAHLCYVIYTSGSTGQPKGVAVEHRNAVNVVCWFSRRYCLQRGMRIAMLTEYTFDASVNQVFASLLNGAALYIIPLELMADIPKLRQFIDDNQINLVNFVPHLLDQMLGIEKKIESLRRVISGGEALDDRVKRNICAKGYQLHNQYGPTETTIDALAARCTEDEPVHLGAPIANTRCYILDRYGNPVPPGVTGELFIAGAGVARGYINRPELTAEKFLSVSYRSYMSYRTYISKRTYKTGDLARWLPDGNIEFRGRIDHQVKINGHRIELGEVEAALRRISNVKEVVVTAAGQFLCAYVVPELKQIEVSKWELDLKDRLSTRLPDYMIPRVFVSMEALPMTSTGKVDRKALPEPVVKAGEDYAAPGNEIETRLVRLWSEILGLEGAAVGIYDNFFRLGGHSLKAVGLTHRIHKEFSIEIPIVELFKTPNIRGIARYIQAGKKTPYLPVSLVEDREYYDLSSVQERLFVLQRMVPDTVTYNISGMMILAGRLEKEHFEAAVKKLIKRHEILRTSFEIIDEVPVQRIHDEVEFKIEYFLAAEADGTRGFMRPFDLSTAPLLRMGLMKTGNEQHILLVDMHHIIADGVSMDIFIKEFSAFYLGEELPEPRVRYRDFSYWQNQLFASPVIEKQRTYWQGRFEEEVPVLNLPYDYPRPLVQQFAGDRIDFTITSEETGLLQQLVLKKGTTPFIMLLAVFNIFLSKLSSQGDIVVGIPTAGRNHPDLEGLMGMFVNTLPLRTGVFEKNRFSEFVEEVEKTFLAASENQDYPYEELVENLALKRETSRNPLYDVVFVLENTGIDALEIPGLKLTPCENENHTAKFDLTLQCIEVGDIFRFIFEYSTALFKESTIRRFIGYFRRLLGNVLETPDRYLWELEIIPEQEKKQVLLDFNAPVENYPRDKTIHELFEEQAEKTPDSIAVIDVVVGAQGTVPVPGDHISITYKQLNKKTNQLAKRLQEKGVGPDTIAAIMMERSLEMIIGILGILKAGGAYLPIDPDYPRERIDFMLKDSNAALLLTAPELLDVCRGTACRALIYQGTACCAPTNLAYIIYTSGTTGNPKGIMVEQRNVVRLVKNTNYIEFKENDRLLPTGALEFDASTFEIWGALLNGLTLFLVTEDEILNPGTLKQNIRKYDISTIWLTSPLFNQLCGEDVEIFAGLKNLLVGGDVLSPVHINRVRRRFPGLTIVNGYGPTENTTFSTTFSIKREYEENIPIGQPIANSSAYIVDKYDQLVPIGVVGELVVGGDGVSRGYMNNPELTAEKFVDYKSYRTYISKKIYKTGDLARWLMDGNIEFLGRRDDQVKIRGFRVETGEIEKHLLGHPEITEAVVIPVTDNNSDKHLCAYVAASSQVTGPGLRDYLSGGLPGYMVPSYFIQLEKIPLTPNGKVDRKVLPLPGVEAVGQYIAPRDKSERILTSIWAEVLGIEKEGIGIDDDFFQLGGHSLKAARLTGRVHKTFDIELPVAKIFETPTIRELAQYINRNRTGRSTYSSIEPGEKKEYYVISSAQKRLFILQQMDETSTAYNVHDALLVEGILQKEKLEGVFRELIARHESLRTSFLVCEGESVQKVHDYTAFELECFESHLHFPHSPHSTHSSDSPEDVVKNFIRPFDLSQAPLLRVGTIKINEKKHILMVDMHHIISDGVSIEVLVKEFAMLFKGEILSELSIQYKDFSQWQNSQKERKITNRQEMYWLKEFESEIPLLELPLDLPRSETYSFDGSILKFKLDREETTKLRRLAAAEDATLFMLLLSCFYVFLAKLSSQEDIVVGTPVAGRRHSQLEPVIGMFVNTLALRNYPTGEKTFKAFLEDIKKHTLAAFENQDYPFEDLVDKVTPRRNLNRNALFDVMFLSQNTYLDELEIPGLTLSPYDYDSGISKFDLLLNCDIGKGESCFTFEYNTTLFKYETLEKWVIYFKRIIASVGAEPGKRIADIEIITVEEKNRVLVDFNDAGAVPHIKAALHEWFEQTASADQGIESLPGEPSGSIKSYILDKALNPQPVHTVGDWYLSGAGLTGEYLSVDSPFVRGERLYRTGARARWLADGSIQLLSSRESETPALETSEYTAPRDELEIKLVDIWAEVLGIEKERIGIDSNFFDLGGHSYSATILAAKILKDLDAKVTLVEIFKNPYIRGTAGYIRGADADVYTEIPGKYASIELVEKREYYPLSSGQQRLFLLVRVGGAVNTVYNLPNAMIVEGRLDKQRLENVFHRLIKRHESLRTSFHVVDSESVQRVHDEVKFEIENYDLAAEKKKEIHNSKSIIQNSFVRPFDLSQAPLMRVGLVAVEKEKHLLIFDMHHIISDGVSMRILVQESMQAYEGKPLPEIPIQYKDFSRWQNRLFAGDVLKEQERYWLDQFKGELPVLNMPTDYPRPAVQGFEGNTLTFYIDKQLTHRLKQILSRTDTTLYMGLLAVYFLLLYKYTEQEDIIIGIASSGRNHADIENVIGVFINTLAIRGYPIGDKTFTHFLEEVKVNALNAYDHQDYPFETLVDRLDVPRDFSRNPLLDVLFVSENVDAPVLQVEGLTVSPYEFSGSISHLDLVLYTFEEGDAINIQLEYSTALFKQSTAERFFQRYIEILKQVAVKPRIKLKDIEISVELGETESGVTVDDFVDFDF